MSVQGWLRKSSPGMLLRIVARQVSDETLSLRLAVTGPALSPARLEASWNVLDWESGPRWQFWIFALRVWRSAALDCWPDPWGTWSLSKSHPAWLQISVGKTDGHDDKATSIRNIQDEVQEYWRLYFAPFHYCYIKNRTHLDDSVLFLLNALKKEPRLISVVKRTLTIDGVEVAILTPGLEFSAFLVTLESKIFFFTTFNSRFLPGT